MRVIYNEFPEEWLTNPNILYHGTSNIFEDIIDISGLIIPSTSQGKMVIETLKDILENDLYSVLDNNERGGLSNLGYYDRELENYDCRPISFAHHPQRCILYASEDFAGGEMVRTVIRAVLYLQDLCRNAEARAQWHNQYCNWHGLGSDAPVLDILQIEEKLKSIEAVFKQFVGIVTNYKYGVIYAVDLSTINISNLGKEAKGLYAYCSIPRDRIVGKIVWTQEWVGFMDEDLTHLIGALNFWQTKLQGQLQNKAGLGV